MSLIQCSYLKSAIILKQDEDISGSRILTLGVIKVNDTMQTIKDIAQKKSHFAITNVTEIIVNTDKKVTQVNVLKFQLNYTGALLTVSENQCVYVIRRGKEEITIERADKLKEGDFLIVQLHATSAEVLVTRINKIEKLKVNANDLVTVKTTTGNFIADFMAVSDKTDVCPQDKIKPFLLQERKQSKIQIFIEKLKSAVFKISNQ
ncbi:UNKNOWN [Stylonychia lemnae]|uniref:Uncharacterized protein n=1 Tax=Stylonychia lemnae TaxID=5949 RepID=A0A078B3B1_STYLE|nr:UNKNOWN [Stylonychia lemnae]|eukprot:CDW88924.1 UNKNOWN [Stylonychia lemnae]